MKLRSFAFAAIVAASAPASAQVFDVNIAPVGFDRWMYPFNGTPATRNLASTFNAIAQAPDFDNKDGQLIIAVNTVAAGIPANQGPSNYQVVSLRVTATHFEGVFQYDPTYDAWQTYLPVGNPLHVNDSDAGRPIELYGVSVRNGYQLPLVVAASGPAGPPNFEEGERYCEGCMSMGQGKRNAFPYDPSVPDPEGDVSNNVVRLAPLTGGGFDTTPFAIGHSTSGLLPGATVPEGVFNTSHGETFEFNVNLSNPDVLAYVRDGLDEGVLSFAITSMHETAQMEGGTNPNFYNKESGDTAKIAPTMEITGVIPEPGFAAGLVASCAGLALLDRRRSARRNAGARR